jgi:hypothetical protein
MPIPAGDSKIRVVLFQGATSIASSSIISPIPPTGTGYSVDISSSLIEISPTAGNIYGIVYISAGSTGFTLTENGSIFNYTHGSTKLIQNNTLY